MIKIDSVDMYGNGKNKQPQHLMFIFISMSHSEEKYIWCVTKHLHLMQRWFWQLLIHCIRITEGKKNPLPFDLTGFIKQLRNKFFQKTLK